LEGFQDDPGDPQADGDRGYQERFARDADDPQENRKVDGERGQYDQWPQENLDLDVPRPLFRASKPAPNQGREQGTNDGDDGQVDRFFGELIMTNKEPLDDLDKQPAAADEGGQSLDDPTLPELGENGPETRFFDQGRFFGASLRRCLLAFRHS